jgi:predicted enzyme involved in methoxymalonyl-ACP biosynthesis
MKYKKKIKLAILGGSTTGLIKKKLYEDFKSKNIFLEIYESDYNQFYFESIKPSKKLLKFKPDFIYLHTSTENIEKFPEVNDSDDKINKLLENNYQKFETIWKNLSKKFKCYIIQNNFENLNLISLGNLENVATLEKLIL